MKRTVFVDDYMFGRLNYENLIFICNQYYKEPEEVLTDLGKLLLEIAEFDDVRKYLKICRFLKGRNASSIFWGMAWM